VWFYISLLSLPFHSVLQSFFLPSLLPVPSPRILVPIILVPIILRVLGDTRNVSPSSPFPFIPQASCRNWAAFFNQPYHSIPLSIAHPRSFFRDTVFHDTLIIAMRSSTIPSTIPFTISFIIMPFHSPLSNSYPYHFRYPHPRFINADQRYYSPYNRETGSAGEGKGEAEGAVIKHWHETFETLCALCRTLCCVIRLWLGYWDEALRRPVSSAVRAVKRRYRGVACNTNKTMKR